MFKYFLPIVCFSLFFILPMKDLKDENKALNDQIYYLDVELGNKETKIDSLSILVNNLNKKIDSLKVKPIFKKKIVLKVDTLNNKININDTIL